jgi:hypothetical protein
VLTVNVSLEDNDDGTITAKADKKLGDLTFTNRYSETHFSKTDMGGEEIEGAKIQILGSDGKVVEIDDKKLEWTSGSDGKTGDKLNDHVVYGLADGVYTMHEVSQPNGYTLAVDIEFEIKDGYVVKVDGKDVNSKTERKVTMIDELTKVNISKTDVTDKDNKEIGGAVKLHIVIFTVIASRFFRGIDGNIKNVIFENEIVSSNHQIKIAFVGFRGNRTVFIFREDIGFRPFGNVPVGIANAFFDTRFHRKQAHRLLRRLCIRPECRTKGIGKRD